MSIAKLIEKIPDTIKADIIDYQRVKLKDGRTATRVTLDRIATDAEKKTRGCDIRKRRVTL